MPELPDVEVYRRHFDGHARHQRIAKVHTEDRSLLEGTTPQGLGRALDGRSFVSTRRHGKYLFGGLDGDGGCLALHFGMTGRLQYLPQSESAPDAVQCLIEFDNGARLAYIATRKLGKISLCDTPESLIQDQKLGPDALDISAKDFVQLASGRRGAVKSWLMNQQIMAGIGNVYSDEILFQTGLHPRRSMEDMTEDDLKRLHAALRKVLEAAIDARADPQQMPDDFLLPQRRKGGHCPNCKGEPETLRVGGRTAWYCPQCQVH